MEIIGNSKNVARLQKHFKKMFAGVASVVLNEDNTEVLGVTSREGEEVSFFSQHFVASWMSLLSCIYWFAYLLAMYMYGHSIV